MHWYWKVRIYDKNGQYWHGQIMTFGNLQEIDNIKDFYETLTGCKMLLEGMSQTEDPNVGTIQEAFNGLWTTHSTGRGGKS